MNTYQTLHDTPHICLSVCPCDCKRMKLGHPFTRKPITQHTSEFHPIDAFSLAHSEPVTALCPVDSRNLLLWLILFLFLFFLHFFLHSFHPFLPLLYLYFVFCIVMLVFKAMALSMLNIQSVVESLPAQGPFLATPLLFFLFHHWLSNWICICPLLPKSPILEYSFVCHNWDRATGVWYDRGQGHC